MGFIIALFIGLFIGILAKFLMPGRDPGGFLITALLGIAGSVIANVIGSSMGYYREGQPAGFIASVIGAMLLLGIYRAFAGRNHQLPH